MTGKACNQGVDEAETTPRAPSLLTGMQPAFRHAMTGESHLAQREKGIPSDEYGFAGLPEDWVVERDDSGNPIALHPDIIAGYWINARFLALSQLSNMPRDD